MFRRELMPNQSGTDGFSELMEAMNGAVIENVYFGGIR